MGLTYLQSGYLLAAITLLVLPVAATVTFTLAALSSYPRKGLVMVLTGITSGISLGFFATSHSFAISLVALAITGFSLVVCLSMAQTLITLLAPDEYRGRLLSIWSMIWSL